MAKPDLNPPYGDKAYQPYSVFSPDAAAPAQARTDIIVVFHGFRSAVPNSTYKRVREAFRATHTVIGINYETLNVDGTNACLDDVETRWLKDRRVVVLGTSLGGYWAYRFGNRIGARAIVMLNPVVDPARQLAKYIGRTLSNARRQRRFAVDAQSLVRYGPIAPKPRNTIPTLVLLAADDARLDYREASEIFGGAASATVTVYPRGGHTLNLREHPARSAIETFLSQN
ncbi:MAG: hypothetical protein OXT06_03425 [Rhodospirillaceae bacterium]|nr:hypothetical protein [Rhodospirillaceae bacterium]